MGENTDRASRAAHLRWVSISDMKVSARGQRRFDAARAAQYAACFDLESLGYPVVNLRDGVVWIVDGQHRIGALKIMGWGDQKVQCEFYEGLTETEEADLFLRRDNRKSIPTFDKFRIGITAQWPEECDIDRIVRANGLVVAQGKGGIGAVGTLRTVYQRSGPQVLGRTLRIIRDAYGDPGFKAMVLEGLGLVCHRYNDQLDDENVVEKLSSARGGVNGLLNQAETLKKQTGNRKPHCVAAAAVEIINRGRGGYKLTPWWLADGT